MWREGEGKREPGPNRPVGRPTPGPKGELKANYARIWRRPAGRQRVRRVPARPPQELGTIEAGSKVEITVGSKERRSRWNSIRRSKALERMMGKRSMTRSRTARKLDAINATLANAFGNGRGSAMVSFKKALR